MFDGPRNSELKVETFEQSKIFATPFAAPAQVIDFPQSNAAYQQMKQDALEKILKAAPKHMRAQIESGGW